MVSLVVLPGAARVKALSIERTTGISALEEIGSIMDLHRFAMTGFLVLSSLSAHQKFHVLMKPY